MKKLIALCVIVAFAAINCKKKKEKEPDSAPADTQVYCAYWYNGNNKTFYKCVTGKDAANATYNELTAGGQRAEVIAKNSCSECQ